MAELVYVDLARAAYEPTLRLQEQLVERVKAGDDLPAVLLLVEHDPPVITLGRGADPEHVVAAPEELAAAGVQVHEITRGGDVTYHGPGQLVGYPIFRLNALGLGVRAYLRELEAVLIGVLSRLGVTGRRIDGLTGVWVGQEKVAAIGVSVRRWVSYHGFALNVSPNLSHFELIVPCGIRDRPVTSLAKILGRPVAVSEIVEPLVACMVEGFGFEAARAARIEELLG